MRRFLVLCAMALICGLAIGGYAIAQEGTPTPASTPDACATPSASPIAGGTPAVENAAATAVASPSACASPTAGGGSSTELTLDMVDIAFKPAEITIPANTDVVLHLVNAGALSHNFTMDSPSITSGDVAGGGQTTVTLNLPAGSYQFFCSIPGHKDLGMIGTLIVQ